MSITQRLSIAHEVVVKLRSQREVATEFNIKPAVVGSILCVFKRKPEQWEELKALELFRAQKVEFVIGIVEKLMKENGLISKAQQVVDRAKEGGRDDIKVWQARQIMHDDCQLRYKQVRRIAWRGNEVRCKVLRQ